MANQMACDIPSGSSSTLTSNKDSSCESDEAPRCEIRPQEEDDGDGVPLNSSSNYDNLNATQKEETKDEDVGYFPVYSTAESSNHKWNGDDERFSKVDQQRSLSKQAVDSSSRSRSLELLRNGHSAGCAGRSAENDEPNENTRVKCYSGKAILKADGQTIETGTYLKKSEDCGDESKQMDASSESCFKNINNNDIINVCRHDDEERESKFVGTPEGLVYRSVALTQERIARLSCGAIPFIEKLSEDLDTERTIGIDAEAGASDRLEILRESLEGSFGQFISQTENQKRGKRKIQCTSVSCQTECNEEILVTIKEKESAALLRRQEKEAKQRQTRFPSAQLPYRFQDQHSQNQAQNRQEHIELHHHQVQQQLQRQQAQQRMQQHQKQADQNRNSEVTSSTDCISQNVPGSSAEGTLRLTITNFRSMTDTVKGETKVIQDIPWRIMVMPRQHVVQKKGTQKCLGFFLQCCPNAYSDSWSCQASAELRLLSQKIGIAHFTRKTNHTYTSKENDWGYSCFMTWADILDEAQGYIKDDIVILEVYVKAEPPKSVLTHEQFVKKIKDYIRLAEVQSSRGYIDKAIDVNTRALNFCKDRDKELKDALEEQKKRLIELKVVESIQRIERRGPEDEDSTLNNTSLKQVISGATGKAGGGKGSKFSNGRREYTIEKNVNTHHQQQQQIENSQQQQKAEGEQQYNKMESKEKNVASGELVGDSVLDRFDEIKVESNVSEHFIDDNAKSLEWSPQMKIDTDRSDDTGSSGRRSDVSLDHQLLIDRERNSMLSSLSSKQDEDFEESWGQFGDKRVTNVKIASKLLVTSESTDTFIEYETFEKACQTEVSFALVHVKESSPEVVDSRDHLKLLSIPKRSGKKTTPASRVEDVDMRVRKDVTIRGMHPHDWMKANTDDAASFVTEMSAAGDMSDTNPKLSPLKIEKLLKAYTTGDGIGNDTTSMMTALSVVGVNCINAKRIANKVARLTNLIHARLRKTSILELLATIADLVDDREFAKIMRSNIEVSDSSLVSNEDIEQELADEVDDLKHYMQNANAEADYVLAKELHRVCCAVEYVGNVAIFKSSVISRAHELPEKFISKMNALQKERDDIRSKAAESRNIHQSNEKQWKTTKSNLEKKLQSEAEESRKNINRLNQRVKDLQDKLAKTEERFKKSEENALQAKHDLQEIRSKHAEELRRREQEYNQVVMKHEKEVDEFRAMCKNSENVNQSLRNQIEALKRDGEKEAGMHNEQRERAKKAEMMLLKDHYNSNTAKISAHLRTVQEHLSVLENDNSRMPIEKEDEVKKWKSIEVEIRNIFDKTTSIYKSQMGKLQNGVYFSNLEEVESINLPELPQRSCAFGSIGSNVKKSPSPVQHSTLGAIGQGSSRSSVANVTAPSKAPAPPFIAQSKNTSASIPLGIGTSPAEYMQRNTSSGSQIPVMSSSSELYFDLYNLNRQFGLIGSEYGPPQSMSATTEQQQAVQQMNTQMFQNISPSSFTMQSQPNIWTNEWPPTEMSGSASGGSTRSSRSGQVNPMNSAQAIASSNVHPRNYFDPWRNSPNSSNFRPADSRAHELNTCSENLRKIFPMYSTSALRNFAQEYYSTNTMQEKNFQGLTNFVSFKLQEHMLRNQNMGLPPGMQHP